MAEIETALVEKVHSAGELHERPALIGFLHGRKPRLGTLIEAKAGQSLKELKREIKKKGGKKLKVYKEIDTIYAEMPVDKVMDLASIDCAQKVYDAEREIEPCLQQSVPMVMGVEKWELPYRVKHRKVEGKKIKVAVIDDGIDKKHPDFSWWRIKRVKKFNGGWKHRGGQHGTHVAGIIAGSGKASAYRYIGVAPKVKLYIAKASKNMAPGFPLKSIIHAIRWAVKKKVHVINMSLGAKICQDGSCPLCRMADYAVRQNIIVVVSAGNAGPAEGSITCPGNARLAITVGSVTKSSSPIVVGSSSRGSSVCPEKPDLVAPGHQITAPRAGGGYIDMSGTSMAAPHVAGLAALLYQAERYLKGKKHIPPSEIKEILKAGCVDIGQAVTAQGKGLVNFKQSLPAIEPPRFLAVLRRRKKKPRRSVHTSLVAENIEQQPGACPAALNMFCPYYDEEVCNDNYEQCIHYRMGTQSRLLRNIILNFKGIHNPLLVRRLS